MADAAREKELKEARERMVQFLRDNPKVDLHAEVGVPRTATPDEINRAYKEHASRLHPNYAEKNYIESKPALKAQFEAMEQAAKDKAKALGDKELADFRATAPQRFDRMPEEQVRGIIADKEIEAGKRKLITPHKGAIEYFSQQNEARLQEIGMRRDILLNADMMTHYELPEKRAGAAPRPQAAGPQATTEPPRATTPPSPPPAAPPQQPRGNAHGGGEARSAGPQPKARPDTGAGFKAGATAAAAGATAGGGSGGGSEPPAGGAPRDSDDILRKANEPHYRPASKMGLIAKTLLGIAAAGGLGWGASQYFNAQAEKDRIDSSPIKLRKYSDVGAELNAADKAGDKSVPTRVFVDQVLGVAGLSGYAGKQGGRELQAKTGMTPQQFFDVSQLLRADEIKNGIAKSMQSPEQKATLNLVQQNGKFVVVKANPDSATQALYDVSPKVVIDITKASVEMTFDDPKSGKGPLSVTYPNAPMAQAFLAPDSGQRVSEQAATWDAATAAAKAASAASSPEAAKKSVLKP